MNIFTVIFYIIGALLSWIIFYYVVKAAVKNGIIEAESSKQSKTYSKINMPDTPANPEQLKLQQRYENGEISFEVYQSEWNKLKH